MKVLWERECPGYIETELVNGEFQVACYEGDSPAWQATVSGKLHTQLMDTVVRVADVKDDNLIKDPGFETGNGWRFYTYEGYPSADYDTDIKHGGTQSALVYANSHDKGTWMTGIDLPVIQGEVYRLSGWMLDTTGKARLVCTFWDSVLKYISGTNASQKETVGEWTRFEATCVPPEKAVFARVECRAWYLNGSAWFDDIFFGLYSEEKTLEQTLLEAAQYHQLIQFNPDAALQKAADADGFVINSPEFDIVHDGTAYRAQRAENQTTGEVRVYYCILGEWDNVMYFVR